MQGMVHEKPFLLWCQQTDGIAKISLNNENLHICSFINHTCFEFGSGYGKETKDFTENSSTKIIDHRHHKSS